MRSSTSSAAFFSEEMVLDPFVSRREADADLLSRDQNALRSIATPDLTIAHALTRWFADALQQYQRGHRADVAFREAIDLACARARLEGIPIERLIVAMRTSFMEAQSFPMAADRRSALIDTIISDCIQRFYYSREELSLDPDDG